MAKQSVDHVKYDEEFIVNSRGIKLFTCKWIPTNQEPKALVFLCHGYAVECSITLSSIAIRFAKAGFAVYGMDYEGHGKSTGLPGYIRSMDYIVEDCSKHYTNICENKANIGKMRYLVGESMGGAVALLLHKLKPEFWDGLVLVAPMCKIVEDAKPPPLVITILTQLIHIVPTWKIIPTKDIIDVAFKMPEVRKMIRSNPYCYKGRPRLKTGYELLRTCTNLEQSLNEVSAPFLVLHGEEDVVTDKAVSKHLYEVASSVDKTIKLYPGMWHGLLFGEPPENTDIVFGDIINWLDARISLGNSRLERELKLKNDKLFKVSQEQLEMVKFDSIKN